MAISRYEQFISAALAEDFDVLEALLAAGHDIDARNEEGESAFSYCCAHDKLGAAKFLYARGAYINGPDNHDATPLDWAVCHASQAFREWLIAIGGRRNFEYAPWPLPDGKRKQVGDRESARQCDG